MNIKSIMEATGITPQTELDTTENAVLLFTAWQVYTDARTAHFIAHKEWLPSYFEKEAELFFGGRYTEERLHDIWVVAHDYLNPNWEQEADEIFDDLTDEQRAELTEAQDDMMAFVAKKMNERANDRAVLAELAKELE